MSKTKEWRVRNVDREIIRLVKNYKTDHELDSVAEALAKLVRIALGVK